MPGLIGEQGRQMARRRRSAVQRDPARQVLAVALSLLGLAALLFAVSAVLGSGTGGMLKPVGQGLRTPVPFLLVLGVALLALHAFLRSRQRPAEPASQAHPFSHEKIIEPVIERQTVRVLQDSEAALGSCKPSGSGQWTMDVFHGIEWRRFEAVCATFFAQAGFEPRSQSHGADGGVDIWLHSKPVEGRRGGAVQALGRQARRRQGDARVVRCHGGKESCSWHLRHDLDVHRRCPCLRKGERHPCARRRSPSCPDPQTFAGAAGRSASHRARRGVLAAHMRLVRNEDGSAGSAQDR